MKIIELKNGITIEDYTDIKCGLQIKNQRFQFSELVYRLGKFYLNVQSRYYCEEELEILIKEINEIKECIHEIKSNLNEKN